MISGKGTWEPITLTLFDVSSGSGEDIKNWYDLIWKFSDQSIDMQVESDYKKDGVLTMLDGSGAPMEIWTLIGCWPQATNWGDLDYSTSDTADIEITLRFDRAKVNGIV